MARAWSLTGTKISQLEGTLTRLAEFEGWILKSWPEKCSTAPLRSMLSQLQESLLVFTSPQELGPCLEKVEFTVGSWCDSVLVESFALLDELTQNRNVSLNVPRLQNLKSMVDVLSAYPENGDHQQHGLQRDIPSNEAVQELARQP